MTDYDDQRRRQPFVGQGGDWFEQEVLRTTPKHAPAKALDAEGDVRCVTCNQILSLAADGETWADAYGYGCVRSAT